MRIGFILLIMMSTKLYCCGQGNNSEPEKVFTVKVGFHTNLKNQITCQSDKFIDTRYVYSVSKEKRLILQNSFPKGGLKYTDVNGNEFIYAIFWNRIINEIDKAIELTINFPTDSLTLTSSNDTYFKLYLPTKKMTPDKEAEFNYGLELESFLDKNINKESELKRIIKPDESSSFYVVAIFKQGVNGTVRAGFSLKEKNLFYRINNKEIQCGQINYKN